MGLNHVCRICLCVTKNPKNLFENEKLINKIEIISSVQLKNLDSLPTKICDDCLQNVNNFYNFREVIINTEYNLISRVDTFETKHYTCRPTVTKTLNETESSEKNIFEDEPEYITVKIEPANIDGDSNDQSDSDSHSALESDPDYCPEPIKLKKKTKIIKSWKCIDCNLTFPTSRKCKIHRRIEHVPQSICDICGKVLLEDNMKRHLKSHEDISRTCDECGKTYKNYESLRTHPCLRKHRAFTCEICGKTFKRRYVHLKHVTRHKDPDFKKLTCNICGKKVNKMDKHMRTHTGEKPHLCSYCLKNFSSSSALKVHLRIHTNEKPYSCEYCNMAFAQKITLTSHMKNRHDICP